MNYFQTPGVVWTESSIRCDLADIVEGYCQRVQFFDTQRNERVILPTSDATALLESEASLNCDSSNSALITQRNPSVCKTYIAYEEIDFSRNVTSIVLVNTEADTIEYIAEASCGDTCHYTADISQDEGLRRGVFNPQLVEIRDIFGELFPPVTNLELQESVDCVLIWAWASDESPLSSESTTDGGGDGTGQNKQAKATLKMIDLPERTWHEPITPNDWQMCDSTDGLCFDHLVDFVASGNQIFLHLAALGDSNSSSGDSNGSDIVSNPSTSVAQIVRRFDHARRTWHEHPETRTPNLLEFNSASEQGLLYWHRTGSTDNLEQEEELLLLAVKYVTFRDKSFSGVCSAARSNASQYILSAYLYNDMLVWIDRDENNIGESGLSNRVHLLDLNKDNDQLFDFNDRFPMAWEYIFDSDNDEIGDQGDLINVYGSCTRSSRRGACIDDNSVLYIVWGVFAAIVAVALSLVVRKFRQV